MTMKTTSPREDGPARKRYETPRLETYGDIRVITEAVAHTGMTDGASMSRKTQ
jgi:hypothetical protein